jgi:hypothetical protein
MGDPSSEDEEGVSTGDPSSESPSSSRISCRDSPKGPPSELGEHSEELRIAREECCGAALCFASFMSTIQDGIYHKER